ncbi:hypothetical protein ACRALDRAFT_1082152 [Sodiomyces alcalophilus JCM 7366]|uniref:uncharacterized protein n=1 Tax=Sodiomyces alcalophilus JCM 7366 TaxID=591952 RepID=UPI0039B522B4
MAAPTEMAQAQVPASTTSASDAASDPKMTKLPTKIRKRAPKACLSCRARKVRCDVSQRGRPCMNCYLDSETCVVTGRASRFRRAQREGAENVQASYPPYSPTAAPPTAISAETVVKSRLDGQPIPLASPPARHNINEAPRDQVPAPASTQPVGQPQHPGARQQGDSPYTHVSGTTEQPSETADASHSSHSQRHDHDRHARATDPARMPSGGAAGASAGSSSTPFASTTFPSSNTLFSLNSQASAHWATNNHDNSSNDRSSNSLGLNSDVTYSYYPFLTIGNLPNIPAQDVNYLELQGCLRVPTRRILDEFVQQYFLHVHPLLPMLNEGDFWDMYCGPAASNDTMSLLLFQSMIFASCNFVSRNSIKALGYTSIRTARAALYRRAKLLHDLDTELSPLAISQAALLLSFWSPPATPGLRKPNAAWLSIAIQHAKTAEAHHYASFSPSATGIFDGSPSPCPSSASASSPPNQHAQGHNPYHNGQQQQRQQSRHQSQQQKQQQQDHQYALAAKKQNTLKRLWWCCIIRDRVMGLGMRRPLHLTRAHFDPDAAPNCPALGVPDLADEISRSRVYPPATKRSLAEVLEQLVELCVVLTDVLVLVFPLDDSPGWGREMRAEERARVRDGKIALRRWYKDVTLRFPMGGGRDASRNAGGRGGRGSEFQHDSVILYTNLMYMYYHSSRVVLSHHEVLHLAITAAAPSFDTIPTRDLAIIGENRHELQDAASGVTECLRELIQLRLARWLPISAVACTALPLVLHILDVKLSAPSTPFSKQSPSSSGDPNTSSAVKQNRLNILIEAMKTYQPQYDGVDQVSETIRHIVNLAQLDLPPTAPTRPISDWTDILASQPSSYLRLALTMDLSLSKGRLPEDRDFPASLRGLFTGGFNPLKSLLENKKRLDDEYAAMASSSAGGAGGMGMNMNLNMGMGMGMGMDGSLSSAYADTLGNSHSFLGSIDTTGATANMSMLQAVDFESGTLRPSLFNLQPGTVTAIPSDEDTDSPGSAQGNSPVGLPDEMSPHQQGNHTNNNGHGHGHGRSGSMDVDMDANMSRMSLHQNQNQQPRPPSEGIAGLSSEVLAASFSLDDNTSPNAGGGFDSMYLDDVDHEGVGGGEGEQGAGDWMEKAWEEIGQAVEDNKADRDSTRALLEALRDGDLGEAVAAAGC